jgi:nitroreductase
LSTQALEVSQPADKLADTTHRVHELIRSRWSPRSFSSRQISDEDLKTVLEAARWAASSYNEQPWRFIIAKKSDPEAFDRLLGVLVPANQAWAKNASVLIVMAAKKTFSHNGSNNHYALHDTGAALANLVLQATALGIYGHGMAGFDRERAQLELNIPDDFEPAASVALGYLGKPEDLELENLRKMETAKRQRKPLSELAFSGTWGHRLAT